jgi:hypothetical protein
VNRSGRGADGGACASASAASNCNIVIGSARRV